MQFAKRFLCCLGIGILFSIGTNSQDQLTMKLAKIALTRDRSEIKIGDKLPIIPPLKVVQYKSGQIDLGDFKGRAIILDFWHQYCSTCIETFSKLENFQKQFKDSLVVIAVTFQSEKSILDFLEKRKSKGMPINLPGIVEDTLLRKYFPHIGDPHEIWIDNDGTVKAITGEEYLTEANLRKLVRGENIDFKEKRVQLDFDYEKPFLVDNNGGPAGNFSYRSIITPYVDSISSRQVIIKDEKYTRIFLPNTSLRDLSKRIISLSLPENSLNFSIEIPNKRIIIETKNKQAFECLDTVANWEAEDQESFRQKYFCCYELILPNSFSEKQAFIFAKQDIERYFQIDIRVEKRLRNVLELKWNGAPQRLPISMSPETLATWEQGIYRMEGWPLGNICGFFNLQIKKLPFVINGLKDPTPHDITLKISADDSLQSIQKQLKKYGLVLVPKKVYLDMVVIRDKK
ncbi:MAG: hypothetical protein C5B52_07765 [Bacteroidetes bacterium]|nr:MAG: hypothetical protein C5B52_07765 [Bacteroidota bacterium]